MARQKKIYGSGQPRGGTPGAAVDSAFGTAANKNRSKKRYSAIAEAYSRGS